MRLSDGGNWAQRALARGPGSRRFRESLQPVADLIVPEAFELQHCRGEPVQLVGRHVAGISDHVAMPFIDAVDRNANILTFFSQPDSERWSGTSAGGGCSLRPQLSIV